MDEAAAPTAEASKSFLACPVMLLSASRQELEHRAQLYRLGTWLGKGGNGTAYEAHRQIDGKKVVVKALEMTANHLKHAFSEALALDRIRGHPHFPELLDVFMRSPGQIHLVLEHAGTDLAIYMRRAAKDGGTPPSAVRDVILHVALALKTLHGIGLAHADVKPHNIFVTELGDGRLQTKLGDLGSVLEALAHRFFVFIFPLTLCVSVSLSF